MECEIKKGKKFAKKFGKSSEKGAKQTSMTVDRDRGYTYLIITKKNHYELVTVKKKL